MSRVPLQSGLVHTQFIIHRPNLPSYSPSKKLYPVVSDQIEMTRQTLIWATALLIVLGSAPISGCYDDDAPFGPYRFGQHEAVIAGAGNGNGQVTNVSGGIEIDCRINAGVAMGRCTDAFADGSVYTELTLGGIAEPGSRFAGWSGCSEVAGNECTIRWTHNTPDTTFALTVRFDHD